LLALGSTLACPQIAAAHHTPGHGASEGVRNINSIGGTGGKAMSRLLVLNETYYTGQGLNPGVNETLSVYGEYAPVPAFSMGVQLPFAVAAFADDDYRPRAGLGDTRLAFRVTPHASKLIHRVFTTGLNLSLPTRTVRYRVDPGRVFQVSPYVIFTRTYELLYWQAIGMGVLDHRPAGVAVDLSVGGQIGSKLRGGKMTLGVGALADIRVSNWHAQPGGGYEFSTSTRPGEGLPASSDERKIGALRMLGMIAMSIQTGKKTMLTASIQAPFTSLQDFSFGATVGFQILFDGSRRRRRLKQQEHPHGPDTHTHPTNPEHKHGGASYSHDGAAHGHGASHPSKDSAAPTPGGAKHEPSEGTSPEHAAEPEPPNRLHATVDRHLARAIGL